jgi:hypothetical protein
LTPEQRQLFAASVDALQQRTRSDLWHDDLTAYLRAQDLLKAARHLEIAAGPE